MSGRPQSRRATRLLGVKAKKGPGAGGGNMGEEVLAGGFKLETITGEPFLSHCPGFNTFHGHGI